jgi:hypothetical protein
MIGIYKGKSIITYKFIFGTYFMQCKILNTSTLHALRIRYLKFNLCDLIEKIQLFHTANQPNVYSIVHLIFCPSNGHIHDVYECILQ